MSCLCICDQGIYPHARSLEIKEQGGNITSIARLTTKLGSSYRKKRDNARATELCEREQETAQEIKHNYLACFVLNNLMNI